MAAAGLLGLALVGAAQAQQATIKRTVLQRSDVPGSTYEVVLGLAELPAAEASTSLPAPSRVPWSRANSPAWFRGSRWMILAGTPHDAKAGPGGAKVIAV